MEKTQRFIVKYYNKNNTEFDFYRHSEKKLTTVLKQEKKFFNEQYKEYLKWGKNYLYRDFFNADTDKIIMKVFETQNARDEILVFEQNFMQFLKDEQIKVN